ncbi:MAG: transporter ATPase, partial [Gammaproteobacteria bacterium]|nr:transporter ATPase [Gammaproteobacteria bacterium]
NGVGKTTLLRILLGQLQPQQGTVRHGTKLEIAYFDQLRADLDESKSVADNISYGDQYVTVNGQSIHIMTYLQDFLFSPLRARSPVSSLSGGERNRLLLARLFTKAANLLVLDEPTNDLDLETLELLESLLVEYTGTLLLVSHDRSFLNNTVTSTMVFNGNGKIEEFVGGYEDWLRQKAGGENPKATPTKPQTTNEDYQIRKEVAALERKIEKCELKQKELKHKLMDPELYSPEQSLQLQKLQQQLQQCEKELTEWVEKWERLV